MDLSLKTRSRLSLQTCWLLSAFVTATTWSLRQATLHKPTIIREQHNQAAKIFQEELAQLSPLLWRRGEDSWNSSPKAFL